MLDVDKYVIMRRVQIHARDLRILDPMLSYPSTILGREKVIVLNLEVNFFGFLCSYGDTACFVLLFGTSFVANFVLFLFFFFLVAY